VRNAIDPSPQTATAVTRSEAQPQLQMDLLKQISLPVGVGLITTGKPRMAAAFAALASAYSASCLPRSTKFYPASIWVVSEWGRFLTLRSSPDAKSPDNRRSAGRVLPGLHLAGRFTIARLVAQLFPALPGELNPGQVFQQAVNANLDHVPPSVRVIGYLAGQSTFRAI
jgi:hypothetical protein